MQPRDVRPSTRPLATAQPLMPMRAKPAPVTFLPARGAATWSPFRQCVAMCVFPGCPYRNRLLLGTSAKLFLVGRRIQQAIEAVLLNHPFVPIPLALDPVLRRIARLGIEPNNRVLARLAYRRYDQRRIHDCSALSRDGQYAAVPDQEQAGWARTDGSGGPPRSPVGSGARPRTVLRWCPAASDCGRDNRGRRTLRHIDGKVTPSGGAASGQE